MKRNLASRRRFLRRSLLLSALGLAAFACSSGKRASESSSSVAAADTALPKWTRLGDAVSPSRRQGASMAYDPRGPSLVLWGGTDEASRFDNQTWLWSASAGWRQVDYGPGASTPHPVQQLRTSRVFGDVSLDSHMVYVDGQGVYLLKDFDNARNELELWQWSGTDWSLVSTLREGSNGPWLPGLPIAAGSDGLYAYEGGFNTNGVDLWKWTSSDGWRQVTVNVPLNVERPTRRYAPGLAFDKTSSSILLVGGYTNVGGRVALTDTWTWSLGSNRWIRHATAHQPPYDLKLAFDDVRHRVVGFSTQNLSTRFEWTGTDWSEVAVQAPFASWPNISGPAFAYDGARDAELLFGGFANDSATPGCCDMNSLWQIGRDRYDVLSLDNDLRTMRVPLRAFDRDRQRLVVLDDVPKGTREFDGQRWSVHAPLSYNTSTAAIAYDSVRKATAVYTQTSSWKPIMCLWNGTAWSCETDSRLGATYHPDAKLAFDEARGQMVLFATVDQSTRVTLLWDGARWSEAPAGSQPRARSSGEAMAYDVARKRVVLPPGSYTTNGVTTADDSTWEWDGASWTEIHAAGFSSTGGVTYSEERRRVVSLTQGAQGDAKLLEWRGTEWGEVATVSALPSVSSIVGAAFPGNPYSLVGEVATPHVSPTGGKTYYATDVWGLASAANDFSLGVSPQTRSILAGEQVTYAVSTTSTRGAPETIQLDVEDLPPGVTGTFNPATVAAGGSTTLTLAATASAPVTARPDTFTVVGTAPSTVRVATAQIEVTRCTPLTACPAGNNCGTMSDGCGGTLECGTCTAVDACHTATCAANVCAQTAVRNGTACSDGNACTTGDVCTSGVCGGAPVVCTNGDACNDPGSCQARTGTCSPPVPKHNGTACSDGNACTSGDRCTNGVCGGAPVVCANGDACNDPGSCQPATGTCSPPVPKNNGTACSDGNACTAGDVCTSGVCKGAPVVCANGDACNDPGSCQSATGRCSPPVPKRNGTTCDDGNACTQIDACESGKCKGSQPVVCAAPATCHAAGSCDPISGACTNPIAGNGTSCDPDDKCIQNGACREGACTGTPVVCTARDECHVVGTCAPASGVCSNPSKADGTPCSLGTCQRGTCTAIAGDAGTDAGGDSGATEASDAGVDAARDAELDAARDAELDAARDAELDAARDAEVDAARDAEVDGGTPEADAGSRADASAQLDSGAQSDAGTAKDASTPSDAASASAGDAGTETDSDSDGGCGCRTVPARSTPSGALLGMSAFSMLGVVRLRRRGRRRSQ
jgi:hypothetical protein